MNLRDAKDRADFAGAETDAMSIAALRTTVEETVDHRDGPLNVVRGRLLENGKQAAFYPGKLPEDPAYLLGPARLGAAEWLDDDYAIMRFAPAPMTLKLGEGPPHIRLDKAAQFFAGGTVMSNQKRGPVLIDLDDQTAAAPAAAPVVPDMPHQNAAMVQVATIAARKPLRLARWFWSVLLALTGFIVSLAAWDYVNGLTARSPVLGAVAVGLLGIFCLILLVIALRELAAIARLRRLDRVHHAAGAALADNDLAGAQGVVASLDRLYRDRDDMTWARDRLAEQVRDPVDADTVLGLVETTLLPPAPICDGQTPVGNRLGQAIPDGLVRRGLAQARGLPDRDWSQHHLLIGKAKRDIKGL